jgi:hypothetical protein
MSRKLSLLTLLLLFCLGNFRLPLLHAQKDSLDFVNSQLKLMLRFHSVQSENNKQSNHKTEILKGFLKFQIQNENENALSQDKHFKSFADFFLLAYRNDSDGNKLLSLLAKAGRLDLKKADKEKNPFRHHVKEAIRHNLERMPYYAKMTNNASKKLSKRYIFLERVILPTAALFDKWASYLRKKDIPVLVNDFASMEKIAHPATKPLRTGMPDKDQIKFYHKILRNYRKQVYSAALKKDFVQIQIDTISAMNAVKKLEIRANCHFALTLHLLESIGLSARNADLIGSNAQSDNFYRAFILSQALGIKIFENIDLNAHQFHAHGIGIIINDLPAIPFP